jgi:glyoxylase-like metal-dependent hydrolase (beta-lactamase superfamily II)
MPPERATPNRREFLQTVGLGAVALGAGHWPPASWAAEPGAKGASGDLVQLSKCLFVYRGPIHVGIIRDGAKALLIDCGDARVAEALGRLGVSTIDQIVFTHHHRDQACGAQVFAEKGSRIGVPGAERAHFEKVDAYWSDPRSRWHIYNQHPHHLMLAEPLRVDAAYADGQTIEWGPAMIRVVATPGHTDGSVTYLVEIDGEITAFCGDAIYDDGRIWELYSLQKGTGTSDYHGFLGARPQLTESLRRLAAARPRRLVPSHGVVMDDPQKAIDTLIRRLDACYEKYVAISALRHYFPKMFTEYAGRPGQMPIRPGRPAPACLRHFGTTWMLVSKDKAAWVMDCGGPHVVERIRGMLDKGEIASVEGLWVTHYHDDHVDGIPAFQKAFSCPCITDRHVAEVIADPLAWRLPCISPERARVDRTPQPGQSWTWREFKMTSYHLPGQTLYHAGLLVESGELRMLFVGDSFTMAGIDDYCAHNRNWLGRGVGFDQCLALIEELRPTHLFNPHVDLAFDFTPEQCRFMRQNLAERERLFGELFPWDHANYGMDELWVRCHPYEQKASAGHRAAIEVVITNHSAVPRDAACRAVLPRAWKAKPQPWSGATIAAKTEGRVPLALEVPPAVPPGRYVIPIDVRYHDRLLPQWTEAIVTV